MLPQKIRTVCVELYSRYVDQPREARTDRKMILVVEDDAMTVGAFFTNERLPRFKCDYVDTADQWDDFVLGAGSEEPTVMIPDILKKYIETRLAGMDAVLIIDYNIRENKDWNGADIVQAIRYLEKKLHLSPTFIFPNSAEPENNEEMIAAAGYDVYLNINRKNKIEVMVKAKEMCQAQPVAASIPSVAQVSLMSALPPVYPKKSAVPALEVVAPSPRTHSPASPGSPKSTIGRPPSRASRSKTPLLFDKELTFFAAGASNSPQAWYTPNTSLSRLSGSPCSFYACLTGEDEDFVRSAAGLALGVIGGG